MIAVSTSLRKCLMPSKYKIHYSKSFTGQYNRLPLVLSPNSKLFLSNIRTKMTNNRLEIPKNLLHILSSETAIQQYLNIYGKPGIIRTAVIKVGGDVIENELKTLVSSLLFLQSSGLFPIVVHGAGPQMNAELEKANVEPQYVNGSRVTDKETLSIAKRIFAAANRKLVDAVCDAGGSARPITSGVFVAAFKDRSVYGYVGDVHRVCGDSVLSAIRCNQIPILSSLGESEDGQTLNINADIAARELAVQMQPHKTIFVTFKGGWIEDDGTKLKEIIMSRDYEKLAGRDYTGRQGTLLKLNEIKALLDALPTSSSVTLTSASALTREILSSCSSGTVCTRGQTENFGSVAQKALTSKFRVGLLGARGYVGREIIRLIGKHPNLELVCASSRALDQQNVLDVALSPPLNPHTDLPATNLTYQIERLSISDELKFCSLGLNDIPTSPYADSVDVWILALPNGHCEDYAAVLDKIKKQDKIIIDMSADQRFNSNWVYGLPERPSRRKALSSAKHIANPGCYATGAQLGLMPLLGSSTDRNFAIIDQSSPPHIFGVSGYSGAGTGLLPSNNLAVLEGNILAYKSVNHIHEREISHQLGIRVSFMPHVAPFFQGIHLTISSQLIDKSLKAEDIHRLYQEYYANEPLVQVQAEVPQVKQNAERHEAVVGGFQVDKDTGRLVTIVSLDNLLKGAATQAIQNINLALSLEEYVGILDTECDAA